MEFLAQTDSGVERACGVDPAWLCQRVYDWTDNESLSSLSTWLVDRPVKVILIVVIAMVARRFTKRGVDSLVERLVRDREADERAAIEAATDDGDSWGRELLNSKLKSLHDRSERSRQRARTLGVIFKSAASAVIFSLAILMLLGEFNINLGPLIASAGIVGIAFGFGAQSLVRDLLSGIFMLIEDQYGVGDIVDVGEATGTVESVGLRTTRLRDVEGTVWYVPNGEIRRVGNMSQLWAKAILDIDVAYDTDLDMAMATIKETADQLWQEQLEEATILEEPVVQGVQTFGADAITIRLAFRTEPSGQWSAARIMRKRLKEAFDASGIEIPFPQRTVWVRKEGDLA
jgi:small-conductance mechanosensitive channel